jgi:predicted exporter
MTRSGWVSTAIWLVLTLTAVLIVTFARYTTDFSAFLPRSPTPTERLLVDQLREGIASRLILIGIEGADASERARISLGMGRRLRVDPQFVAVNNGEASAADRDRALLFDHRYLLSEAVTPEHFTAAGLRDSIQATLDTLASPAGSFIKTLIPSDPTGETLQVIDQLGSDQQPPTSAGVWASRDGKRALLVVQTRAAGSDTDGQQEAMESIRRAFNAAVAEGKQPQASVSLEMSGPGVFSVTSRATIKQQVSRLSVASIVLILLMLLWVYRSIGALLLGLLPVATGALAGVAAVQLGFGSVHGITLGFGVTLIGEAVDYSIYLFIQSERQLLWQTIRLGVLTSIVGFVSLLPSSFQGLAQLGLFSISGLLAAALVTRYVLPHLLPRTLHIRDLTPLGEFLAAGLRRAHLPGVAFILIPIAAGLVLYLHRGPIWNPELAALSTVTEAEHALDTKLRSDIGAPDAGYLVIVSGPGREAVLRATEAVDPALDGLVEQGVLSGFQSPARYLPSLLAQKARQESLPDAPTLHDRLATALDGLPIRLERLEPFLHDVEAARRQPLLTREALAGTSIASGVDALLIDEGTRWHALLPLRIPDGVAIDVGRVHSAISKVPLGAGSEAVVLDVKGEVDRLYSTYLSEALRLSAAGFVGIVVLLLIFLRSLTRTLRVVAPLVLAVLAVVAGLVLMGPELTILHLIGMLLIVAVGSNYALFFDRRAADPHAGTAPLTLASLLIANVATVLGFGVLSFSSVPILQALGSTVAPGAFLALLFSALLRKGA